MERLTREIELLRQLNEILQRDIILQKSKVSEMQENLTDMLEDLKKLRQIDEMTVKYDRRQDR
jgi:archaellum component FlaC